MIKYTKFKNLKNKLLKDPEINKGYRDLGPEFSVIEKIIEKRIKNGLTQKQLAKKAKTKQPVISRFERGDFNPSLQFLYKIAEALDMKLKISIS